MSETKQRSILKTIGPGLLFASSAIGTSHLVLCTRAGAHHGISFLGIIILTLLLKYPFYEFGTRYSIASNKTLISAYRQQGKLPLLLFFSIVTINMFAVNAAVAAVSAGLLSIILGIKISVPILAGIVLAISVAILYFGNYSLLDNLIKLLSVILLVTVSIAFVAVLIEGPPTKLPQFTPPTMLEGAGLALLISLIGWMPAGMEASTMNSIWVVEKIKLNKYRPTLKEGLFDFKLGFIFTSILAMMFLIIGAYSVYGTGELLEGNATKLSQRLIHIFTDNLGPWSFWVISIAAFGTIYGTLITVMDAFTRSFVICLDEIVGHTKNEQEKDSLLRRHYKIVLPILGLGSFLLFYFSSSSMIKILEFATILGFLTSPIIAFLNLQAVTSPLLDEAYRPSKTLIYIAYVGLIAMIVFALFYVYRLIV